MRFLQLPDMLKNAPIFKTAKKAASSGGGSKPSVVRARGVLFIAVARTRTRTLARTLSASAQPVLVCLWCTFFCDVFLCWFFLSLTSDTWLPRERMQYPSETEAEIKTHA